MRSNLFFIFIWMFCMHISAQDFHKDSLLMIIKEHPVLSFGGSEIVRFNGNAYLIGNGFVEVKGQSRSMLERIGKMRAEKEVVTFVNGSEFTSSAMATITETTTQNDNEVNVETSTQFIQKIQENSEGFIREMRKLSSYYSDDRSLFFYILIKELHLP